MGGHNIWAVIPQVDQYHVGSEAMLIIRPENVEIVEPNSVGKNIVSGTVKAKIYLGSTIRYLVDAGERKEIEIDVQPNHTIDCNEYDMIWFKLDDHKLISVKY